MGAGHIRLYDLFRKELNLPDDKAAAFVLTVEDVCGVESETRMQFVATKDDLGQLRNDNRMQFAAAREDAYQLKLKIERSKNDFYKAAIFLVWIAQLIAILAAAVLVILNS